MHDLGGERLRAFLDERAAALVVHVEAGPAVDRVPTQQRRPARAAAA